MRTTIIMYMPGHAGNLVLRLVGLSDEMMPAIERRTLFELVNTWTPLDSNFNRLEHYKFSGVPSKYGNWQKFHRSYADYLDNQYYSWLNLICESKYNLIYAVHPHELDADFLHADNTDFYYVELDSTYDSWVEAQRVRLKFVWRDGEAQQFEKLKQQYSMKPISLTAIIEGQQSFVDEYLRVCKEMKITPKLEQATELLHDWKSIRFQQK